MEDNTELQALQKYLGLDNDIESARKAKWIIEELRTNYGDWGNKVATYFSSILSSSPGSKIDREKIELYKSLFTSHIIQEESYGERDKQI